MPNIQIYTTETIPTIAVEILRTAAIEIIQLIEIKSTQKKITKPSKQWTVY